MFVHTMTYFENNLIFHKKEKSVVNIVQFLMKFFVLLYINSPVFEKQIKPAKNKQRFISLVVSLSLCLFLNTMFGRTFELPVSNGIM